MVKLISPENGFVFDTYTHIQAEYIRRINADGIDKALRWLEEVKDNKERSHPESLDFLWESDEKWNFVFEISETEDFLNERAAETTENHVTVTNLKVGTRYFWRVNGGETRFFDTESRPIRFIKIDGILNVRDVGGNKIKQGLLYRGSELNSKFNITDKGKETFIKELGIKTELDLRAEQFGILTECPAGSKVSLKQLPYRPYLEVFEDEHREGIKRIMEFLSHESNYPIYFHCLGGADRTGMVAFFLRALCGEDDNTIHTDYEMTALSTYAEGAREGANGFRRRTADYYVAFLNELDKYTPGKSLSKKVPVFLKECGVTVETINKIIEIIKE